MEKRNLEACPYCGKLPTLKVADIYKLIGSPGPTNHIYYYTCECDKVIASSANDTVMSAEEARDYAGYLWNRACKDITVEQTPEKPSAEPQPQEPQPQEMPATQEVKEEFQVEPKVQEELPAPVEEVQPVKPKAKKKPAPRPALASLEDILGVKPKAVEEPVEEAVSEAVEAVDETVTSEESESEEN